MKYLATVLVVPTAGDPKLVAISPQDNVWLVEHGDLPDTIKPELDRLLAGRLDQVVGHVFGADNV